jgi:hypothetical protein
MKRFLLGLVLLAALAAPARAQQTNALTKVFVIPISGDCETTPCSAAGKQMCREAIDSTVAFLCNGTSGFYDIAISAGAASGAHLNLEGPTGDSYLVRDPATGFIFVYLDGSLRATITPRGVIPGQCPSDPYSMEGGTECYDPATGKRMTLDWRGLHEVGQ